MSPTKQWRACPPWDLTAAWRTSSHSGNGNNCVEVVLVDGRVAVRDSKDRSGPVLHFTRGEWRAFLAGVCAGGG